MIGELKNKLEDIKTQLESEILNSDLNIYEKLFELEKNNIWEYDDYITHPFKEWEEENVAAEKEACIKAGETYHCTMVDTTFTDSCESKHEKISFLYYFEDWLWHAENEPNKDILVATNRGKCETKTYKKPQECIDKLWDYCVKNRSVGFYFDW